MNPDDIYIIAARRSPLTKAHRGALAGVRPDELLAQVLAGTLADAPLPPEAIDDVVVGCAFPEGEQGMNLGRMAALRAGLPASVPGMVLNRYCASGLEAIAVAAQRIAAGDAEAVVAGGVESMSRMPIGGHTPRPNPTLAREQPQAFTAMGTCGNNTARAFGITREDADAFALTSHRRAGEARESGAFAKELLPIQDDGAMIADGDDCPRPGSTPEGLAALPPAFAADPAQGVCTAGNSSQMSDGAAAVLLVHRRVAEAHGIAPLARFGGYAVRAGDPRYLGPAQVEAVQALCTREGVTPADVPLWECNEAFATQTLYVQRALGLDHARLNVHGGAIALGHPLGCSGARVVVTLLHAMAAREATLGGVTLCVGGGMGVAALFRRG